MEPPGTPNLQQSRKVGTQKTSKNNTAKSRLLVENDLKRGAGAFAPKTSPKSQKSEPWAQNVPQASRRGSQAPKILKNHQKKSPRASKITQNHENLVTQKQENPRKKTSRIQEIKMRHGGGLCAQRPGYICIYTD